LIVGWCGRFLFFVVPLQFFCQFSQDIGEWPENQILIPDWTDLHCPGTTLPIQASLMEPPKLRFFIAHEKGSFGHEAKKRAPKGCSFRMQARRTEMEGSNFGERRCGG